LYDESESINHEVSTLLEEQSKRLAQRARVQWIEKGEKSNKYFMNLIKSNQQRQMFTTILREDGTEAQTKEDIIQEIHTFYQNLYEEQVTDDHCEGEPLNLVTTFLLKFC